MADSDYVSVYRQFFEEFAVTSSMEDCRLMRVNPYNLSTDELVGEVMQCCVNYLIERKCPRSLVIHLTKIVVEELLNEAKKQPEEVNTPLKLNKKTHDKISEVCLRYTDNEKLSNLPGPVQETYYSAHSTKHTRRRMEDRLICLPKFNTLHGIQSNSEAGYYGIFDGHGGVNAASYAVSHLHQFLAESEYYPDDPVQAFLQAFEKTEYKYNLKDEDSGTTALAILHQPAEKKLTVAWVGDSEAVLANKDSYVKLVDPHKPNRTDERKRIEEIGGCIVKVDSIYRVNGGLAISRAIGDRKMKPYIIAEPEIRVINLTGSEHFIVMGCDGLWDVVEPLEAIETVYFEVKKTGGQIDSVGKRLVDLAKAKDSTDNISVIVIFLTDPTELSNRSVDVTGHRPNILRQDGVIMEANFQTNDNSAFSDPSMNGIFETNGNHFNEHMQKEFDEDFGPETDVDAVDDVLTSPKNSNPFAKDCWQEMADGHSDKLIELPRNVGDEIIKFAEDFSESAKPLDDINPSQINSNDVRSDKFPVDNMNPFEAPVTNNTSEASKTLSNFADDDDDDDNNKYLDEINSRKEKVDNCLSPNVVEQSFGSEGDAGILEKPQEKNAEVDLFSFDSNNLTDAKETAFCTAPQDKNVFSNEISNSNLEETEEGLAVESASPKEPFPKFNSAFDFKDDFSNENCDTQTNEINALNKTDEAKDSISRPSEEAVDLTTQSLSLDDSGNPPAFCSATDVVAEEKAPFTFCPVQKSVASKEDDPRIELLSPTSSALDGELKDETIAESGGEVEDSEEDEWNYIKVESGVHQNIPVESKVSDSVPSPNELSETEKPTMNSPLNPEADEFIPVSAMSSNNDYTLNSTPKKAIPDDLADIIASSPNWNNMNNVSLPEESAFLNEIKSRPSNIFENIESRQEDFIEENSDVNNSLNFLAPGETEKEDELVTLSRSEPHGLDLANDMTSSFIDPSTMGAEIEISKEYPDLMNSRVENSDIEIKELSLDESVCKVQGPADTELPPKLPDLLSPMPVSATADVSKVDTVEASLPVSESVTSDVSQPIISELLKSESTETKEKAAPSSNEEVGKSQLLSETFEISPVEEKQDEKVPTKTVETAVSSAVAVTAVAATVGAAAAAAAKKDVKKSTPKATSVEASKTAAASAPILNGTKTSATTKKPTSSVQATKTAAPRKTPGTTAAPSTKTAVSKTSSVNKTQQKSTPPVSSTLNKVPARTRPTSTTLTAAKASPPLKPTVTVTPTKPPTTAAVLKSSNKSPGSAPVSTTLKAKPRVSSATVERKSISTVNGETRSAVKRTEVITKKTNGATSTSTTTTTTTRVSLSARPTTAPSKPINLKTAVATAKTLTAKPKPTLSTSTSSTLTSSSRVSPITKKSTVGADKQAKEVANRITSKTSSASKTNGVTPRSTTTTVTKTRKTLTTTTTTAPSKTKNHDKTENKAERILDEKVEIIQSENGAPLIDKNTVINIVDSIASDK